MSNLHQEINFENVIWTDLAAGWLYAEGDAAQYDRSRALFPADVVDWVQSTQPKAWASPTVMSSMPSCRKHRGSPCRADDGTRQ